MGFKDLFGKKQRSPQEVATSLDSFVQGNWHQGNLLTKPQAQEAINQGLVELVYHDQHIATGLLLTDDGYFLVPHHKINDPKIDFFILMNKLTLEHRYTSPFGIIANDGKGYVVEKVCFVDPEEDVALVKAKMSGEGQPKVYTFGNNGAIQSLLGAPVIQSYKQGGEVKHSIMTIDPDPEVNLTLTNDMGGKVTQPKHYVFLDYYPQYGDPGQLEGVLSTGDGEIIGMLSGGI